MDVNEKIVECWLNNCKNIFTISNVEYNIHHSAIDILGIDLKRKEVLDIEVKFKAKISIGENKKPQNGFLHFKKQLLDNSRDAIIARMLPVNHNFTIKKIFITTKHFFTVKKYDYWLKRFKKEGISLIFFEDIMKELREKAGTLNKANDEILQTLRVAYMSRNN